MISYINLEPYRTSKNHSCIVGYETGEKACYELDFTKKMEVYDKIILSVPSSVITISSTFFIGLLRDTFRTFGHSHIKRKICFTFKGRFECLDDYDDAMSRMQSEYDYSYKQKWYNSIKL